jgi:hypothetical protein
MSEENEESDLHKNMDKGLLEFDRLRKKKLIMTDEQLDLLKKIMENFDNDEKIYKEKKFKEKHGLDDNLFEIE